MIVDGEDRDDDDDERADVPNKQASGDFVKQSWYKNVEAKCHNPDTIRQQSRMPPLDDIVGIVEVRSAQDKVRGYEIVDSSHC